ncbi:MAG: amidohydrolase family protein [Acetatifactor sp.]|nr:amidohydrolase family protein [Acetatifactor sp.]
MKKIIKGGNVVFENEVKKADILINDEKIEAIYSPGSCEEEGEIIDASGMYVFPGTIDPHSHLDNHVPLDQATLLDSKRQAIGGLTTMVPFIKLFGSFKEELPNVKQIMEENSLIDFGFSCFLFSKQQFAEVEDVVRDFGVTSFKFIFDKQDIVHLWYPIEKENCLTLDKGDFYYILKRLREISPKLVLCVHCEDPDIFRRIESDVKEQSGPEDALKLSTYDKVRPGFCETVTMADTMYINHVLDGNVYMVHTANGDSVKMYETLSKEFPSNYTMETCPQYLTFSVEDAKCGVLGKVNPPIHHDSDREALWKGILDGTVKCIGTDNVPAYMEHKQPKGNDLWTTALGFGTPGLILPTLITYGYFERNIPLWRLAQVSSTNVAKKFNLETKGQIKPGFDADFAIVDLDWERTITKDLFGCSDYSIYEGITYKGWPRYTISRGEIIQKNGEITAKPGRGKYLFRKI